MLGPVFADSPPLPPVQETFKLLGFVDDLKPSITSMQEFILVDKASLLFEEASGCELHRDPASGKVKFLPLGRWRGTLQQEDLPVPYIKLSDHLDMLGVKLMSTYSKSKKANGDEIKEKFSNLVGSWRAGRFMPLSQRPWSLNS